MKTSFLRTVAFVSLLSNSIVSIPTSLFAAGDDLPDTAQGRKRGIDEVPVAGDEANQQGARARTERSAQKNMPFANPFDSDSEKDDPNVTRKQGSSAQDPDSDSEPDELLKRVTLREMRNRRQREHALESAKKRLEKRHLRKIQDKQKQDLNRVLGGEKNLQGVDLSGQDLKGFEFIDADLSNANLTGTILTNAKFTRTKLVGATLHNTHLDDAVFDHADLEGATITDVTAKRVHFTNNTVLKKATVIRVLFDRAEFRNVDFSGIETHVNNIKFVQSDLENVNLSYVKNIDGIFFINCPTFSNIDFSYSTIQAMLIRGIRILDHINFDSAVIRESAILGEIIGRDVSLSQPAIGPSLRTPDITEQDLGWGLTEQALYTSTFAQPDLFHAIMLLCETGFTRETAIYLLTPRMLPFMSDFIYRKNNASLDEKQQYAPANINTIISESEFNAVELNAVRVANIKFGNCRGIDNLTNTVDCRFYNVISSNQADIELFMRGGARVNGVPHGIYSERLNQDPELGAVVTELVARCAAAFITGGASEVGRQVAGIAFGVVRSS
jgi:uncharacterized protein YjbI with pentapeptide repeats